MEWLQTCLEEEMQVHAIPTDSKEDGEGGDE